MGLSKALLVVLSFLFAAAVVVSAGRELAESTEKTQEKAATTGYGYGGGYGHVGGGYGHGGYDHGEHGHYPPKSASDEQGRHLVEEEKAAATTEYYGRGGYGGGGYGHGGYGGGGYGHGGYGGGGYGHG
ncbi:hypothetical protein AKJ16_DCAP27435, partial [Drosera capensis]